MQTDDRRDPEAESSPAPPGAALIVLYRDGRESDVNFVLNSWLRSSRNRHYFDAQRDAAYYDDASGYQGHIKRVLERRDTTVTIACHAGDEDQILGYAVTQPATVHYVYVKTMFRKQGIAKALVWRTVPKCGREVCACGSIASLVSGGAIVTRPSDGVMMQTLCCKHCGAEYQDRRATMVPTTCTQTMYGWRELSERFRLVFNPWG